MNPFTKDFGHKHRTDYRGRTPKFGEYLKRTLTKTLKSPFMSALIYK